MYLAYTKRARAAGLACAAALAVAAGAPAVAQQALTPEQGEEVDARVRDYILANPEIILEALEILESRRGDAQAMADAQLVFEHGEALLDDGYSPVFGAADGDVTVVEFSDYRCGYCKAAHPHVAELLEGDAKLRLVHKQFPILGADSVFAARAAMAAQSLDRAAHDRFHDAMMTFRGSLDEAAVLRLASGAGIEEGALRAAMDAPEIAERIRETYALAKELKIEGTPSFIIGDRILRGYVEVEQMRELVAEARAAAQ